jgi:hypothetical protein
MLLVSTPRGMAGFEGTSLVFESAVLWPGAVLLIRPLEWTVMTQTHTGSGVCRLPRNDAHTSIHPCVIVVQSKFKKVLCWCTVVWQSR